MNKNDETSVGAVNATNSRVADQAPRRTPTETPHLGDGALILVVDDNPRNVDVLVKLLSVRGYEPAVASSGERAIDLAHALQPDLILLDVEMPGMSGFNVCRILTAQPETQHIPIIFVTGHTDHVAKALEAGAVDFIAKPVQAADLYARVGTRLRVDALQAELRDANQKLIEANTLLEERVAERTAELQIVNRDLRKEIDLRQLVSERLDFLTTHDSVTRLPNPATFADQVLEVYAGRPSQIGFLRIEVDHLNLFLARHGDRSNDNLFSLLSSAVRSVCPAHWLPGRLDPRSICAIAAIADKDEAEILAERVAARFDELLASQFTDTNCRALVGVVTVEGDEFSLGDLSRIAEEAVDEAAESGQPIVVAKVESVVGSKEAALWLDRIIEGIDANHFVLYGQPIRGLGQYAGQSKYELLMRWQNPETGDITPPGAFLNVAERHRLMPQLDRWAVGEALRLLNLRRLTPGTTLALNLSGQSLSEVGFGDWLLEAIAPVASTPYRLAFEITEQQAVRQIDMVQGLFVRLREEGHLLSLDDFGTGFASYSYLKAIPVDLLKIDRSFIIDICTDAASAEMVRSMTQLGHALGMATVAEGVETADMMEAARALGVDYVQGWHIGRPASIEMG